MVLYCVAFQKSEYYNLIVVLHLSAGTFKTIGVLCFCFFALLFAECKEVLNYPPALSKNFLSLTCNRYIIWEGILKSIQTYSPCNCLLFLVTVNRNMGLLSRSTDQHPTSLTLQRWHKSLGGLFFFPSEPQWVFMAPALFSLFHLLVLILLDY